MANNFVDRVAFTLPWLGSLIPAIMTYENAQLRLGFYVPEAAVIGVVVEGLGFASITTTLDIFEQDQAEGRGITPQFCAAAGGTAVYLVVVVLVNAVLDPGDWVRKLTLGLLALLAVVGGLMVALRNQLTKRREAAVQAKAAVENEKTDELAYQRKKAEQLDEMARLERKEAAERQQQLKLARLEARKAAKSQKVAESDVKVSEGKEKVADSDGEVAETFGKWRRWPDVPDEHKQQVAETIAEMKGKNAKNYKKMVATHIVKNFGIDERVAYTWIQYAERDYGPSTALPKSGSSAQDELDEPINLEGDEL